MNVALALEDLISQSVDAVSHPQSAIVISAADLKQFRNEISSHSHSSDINSPTQRKDQDQKSAVSALLDRLNPADAQQATWALAIMTFEEQLRSAQQATTNLSNSHGSAGADTAAPVAEFANAGSPESSTPLADTAKPVIVGQEQVDGLGYSSIFSTGSGYNAYSTLLGSTTQTTGNAIGTSSATLTNSASLVGSRTGALVLGDLNIIATHRDPSLSNGLIPGVDIIPQAPDTRATPIRDIIADGEVRYADQINQLDSLRIQVVQDVVDTVPFDLPIGPGSGRPLDAISSQAHALAPMIGDALYGAIAYGYNHTVAAVL